MCSCESQFFRLDLGPFFSHFLLCRWPHLHTQAQLRQAPSHPSPPLTVLAECHSANCCLITWAGLSSQRVWNGTSYHSYRRLSTLPHAPRFTSQWMCVIQQVPFSLRLGNPPSYLYPSLSPLCSICHQALELSLLSALCISAWQSAWHLVVAQWTLINWMNSALLCVVWHCNNNQGHLSGPISSACFLSVNSYQNLVMERYSLLILQVRNLRPKEIRSLVIGHRARLNPVCLCVGV